MANMILPVSRRQVLTTLLLLLFLFPMSSYARMPWSYNISSSNDLKVPIVPDLLNYGINLVFLGINDSRVDQESLLVRLPRWYAPADGMYWRLEFDMNFTLTYNLVFADKSQVDDYRTFLHQNSVEDRSPLFIQPEYPMAKYIHSSIAESYLTENVIDKSSATLVIIDTYSFDPAGHVPYYYNATYNELDAELEGWVINPIPWASTYQIAGGGENSRLLWLDLSAGPTTYHSTSDSSTGGVEEILPIWTYEELTNPVEQLTEDLVKYITQAIECRFLPSTHFRATIGMPLIYSPTTEIAMEVLLVDLANTNYKFEERLKLDYIVSEYERVNPYVKCTYTVSEWDWESDPSFLSVLEASKDDQAMTYDPRILLEFFDQEYIKLFHPSSYTRLVLPIFLLTIPVGWNFDPDWGGMANNIAGEFSYIYGKQSLDLVDPSYIDQEIIPLEGLQIESGDFFHVSGYLGRSINSVDFSMDVLSSTVSIYFLDEYGYNQYEQALPFVDLLNRSFENVSVGSGTVLSNFECPIYGRYHMVIENNENETATVNITLNIETDQCYGYTWKIMHEIGHALGLNHPHIAYSWGNYNHPNASPGIYVNWLWDMSYSHMNYANQAPTISLMDIDTLQRESITRYWEDAVSTWNDTVGISTIKYGGVPSIIKAHLLNASKCLDQSVEYYSNTSRLDNYYNSLLRIFDMWNNLRLALAELAFYSQLEIQNTLFIVFAMTVIILVPLIYVVILRRRKRD
ncbi:MAG: M66 family metalloprotease [Candidatus Thorarchaeota archaeon]